MDILQSIITADTNIFLFFNGLHARFFDTFMYLVSEKFTWVPFYIALLYVVIKNWKKESIGVIIALILCIVLADQIASGLIKHWVERPRPSHEASLDALVHIVNGYRGGRFGFVSSHAANTFGLALLSSLLLRRKAYTWIVFAWAILNSYSRIYLGVHYPLDIVGGILVGFFAAGVCYWALRIIRPLAIHKSTTIKEIYWNNIVLIATVLLLLVISAFY